MKMYIINMPLLTVLHSSKLVNSYQRDYLFMSNCKLSIQINLKYLVKNGTFLIKCSQKYVEKTTHVTNEGLLYFGMILCVNKCIDRILLHVFYRKKCVIDCWFCYSVSLV